MELEHEGLLKRDRAALVALEDSAPLDAYASIIHAIADAHGFWPKEREYALESLLQLEQMGETWDRAEQKSRCLVNLRQYVEAQPVRNMGEMLMLVVSELAEALEAHRDGDPAAFWRCKECGYRTEELWPNIDVYMRECIAPLGEPTHMTQLSREKGAPYVECDGEMKPEGVTVEGLDAVIRILDMLHGSVPSLDEAAVVKIRFNADREHMHGKAY